MVRKTWHIPPQQWDVVERGIASCSSYLASKCSPLATSGLDHGYCHFQSFYLVPPLSLWLADFTCDVEEGQGNEESAWV